MTPSSVLRQRARRTLGGNIFGSEWIYGLLVSLVFSLFTGISATGVLAILVFVLSGAVSVGYCKYFLERARGNISYDNISVCLDGFRGDMAPNIVTGLLVFLYTFLWTLLFIIPGIIKSYSYSMAYYIRCDHPEYTATEAIKESQRIMQGNKMRLFCLHLSFLGWIIVGALCLGVGLLWVAPYQKAAEAEFYRDIVESEPLVFDRSGRTDDDNIFDGN